MVKVTIWNENRHEQINPDVKNIYPSGIHTTIATFLNEAGYDTTTTTLEQAEHGLTDEVLANTDVLIWWGHIAHNDVEDPIVEKVYEKVLQGMGLIVLHSGHFSKIFKKLMGTSCDLKWREKAETERLWVVDPSHPIVDGIGEYIEIDQEEMYGEHFDIPTPDELVLVSWFKGGEVFRSGCTFKRGNGKIFYFRPGHETYPTYHHKEVQKIIINAVNWANKSKRTYPSYGYKDAIEALT
ncbi:ThuA domain-containing protein [Bacillus sp. AFS055030]|uniref:ThuA domain-containing protein n=1 Tax=Bacillus sp. AFS055030 TaxID=2033507 RepID=UPI000BFB5AA8|nr:ThuA domain-containing protein [Bacillus sp. AFS055030]PGL70113.1 trehalose utilization protein ThuA [Bacillus sp. AFS055030]